MTPTKPSQLATADDVDLMRAFQGGEIEAFEELFRRYERPIWGYFRRRVGDDGRAEELAQDTFLALLKSAARWEPRATVRTYLYSIALNLLAADRRRRKVVVPLVPEMAVVSPSIEDALWMRRALAQIDEADREVVMLREFESLSYAEIAAVLGIPLNTVRSRLFRAREALRERLRPEPIAKGRVS